MRVDSVDEFPHHCLRAHAHKRCHSAPLVAEGIVTRLQALDRVYTGVVSAQGRAATRRRVWGDRGGERPSGARW
jgi:hypothetical protein